MPEPVLDAETLWLMAVSSPDGVRTLLDAVASPRARFPAEVYNRDESSRPLDAGDGGLSLLARDLRFLERRAAARHWAESQAERTRLMNAGQLGEHLARGSLVVDPLTVEELPQREDLEGRYGIGRGEAACLVLAERYEAQVVLLSLDGVACRAAQSVGVRYVILRDALAA